MMEYVKDKTDYVLHLDADDILAGDFSFTNEDAGEDCYYMTMKRGSATYKATVVYNNRLRWKFCGTAHTIIKCIDRPNYSTGDLSTRGWVICDPVGSRAFDPKKYFYDAERLKKQFFDTLAFDPDGLNHRSAFYCAQSYMDSNMMLEGLQWNRLYTRLKDTWSEERFEAQMRISRCLMALPDSDPNLIVDEMNAAITLSPDRAEPYYYLGLYLNKIGNHTLAYDYLSRAKKISLKYAQSKYLLFVNATCYGKYINDELSVACFWTNRVDEGVKLINEIINDPEFEHAKPRLIDNLNHFKNLEAKLENA
jgi:hypothetical protein